MIHEVFKSNTDAPATNRGFYYQFLCTLDQWVDIYINNNKEAKVFVEVDEDIKVVGDELVFTQVKSYTGSFDLGSNEVIKTLFNFFILYLQHKTDNDKIQFCFLTNTKPSSRAKLLKSWIADPLLSNDQLKKECIKKIREILKEEFKARRDRFYSKRGITTAEKSKIYTAYSTALIEINKESVLDFIHNIKWDFIEESPENVIEVVQTTLVHKLNHKVFNQHPINLLLNLLLTEIYKVSCKPVREDRFLNNIRLRDLIIKSESEILSYIDKKFIDLLSNEKFHTFSVRLENLTSKVDIIDTKVGFLQKQVDIIINSPDKPTTFIKELNFIPQNFSENIFGRHEIIEQVHSTLQSKKIITLSAISGLGKTTVAKAFINKHKTEYDHIIWINYDTSLKKSFILDSALITNIGIQFKQLESIDINYDLIANQLKQIPGKNILIFDGVEQEEGISFISELSKINNFDIILTSKQLISGSHPILLPILDFEASLLLAKANCAAHIDEIVFKEFLEFIGYNTLMTELCAKTIQNSLDLDFGMILNFFKEQNLNSEKLNIDVELTKEVGSVKLFTYLLKMFELNQLSKDETYFIELLALLPSNDIVISELISIYGQEDLEKNKTQILNWVNSLHSKGWINRDRESIKIHKLIQEAIKYRMRETDMPGDPFLINFLCHRLKEANDVYSPSAYVYIKYTESILSSIKEIYRGSIYQPLLVLENNLIEAYRYTDKVEKVLPGLIDLKTRAEKHLPHDNLLLATINYNLANSYAEGRQNEIACVYLLKAIDIYKIYDRPEAKLLLLRSLGALASGYVYLNKINELKEIYDQIAIVIQNYEGDGLELEITVLQSIIADAYLKINEYEKAIECYKMSIGLHLSYEGVKNDLNLAIFYDKISICYFRAKKLNDAIICQLRAIRILEGMKLYSSPHLFRFYRGMIFLLNENNKPDKARDFEEKLKELISNVNSTNISNNTDHE